MWILMPMLFCAAAAFLLIGLTAYHDLRELWMHPDRRPTERIFPSPKSK